MKRSEMISILQDAINDITCDFDFYISDRGTEKVLKKIEDSGMLPPEIDKMIEKHLCSVNEWEPETTTCKDCGVPTTPGVGSARCKDCWNSRFGEE